MGSNIKIDVRKERLQNKNSEDEFRDSIATVDEKGKRLWIYPKKPSGKFHAWRIVVTVILIVAAIWRTIHKNQRSAVAAAQCP